MVRVSTRGRGERQAVLCLFKSTFLGTFSFASPFSHITEEKRLSGKLEPADDRRREPRLPWMYSGSSVSATLTNPSFDVFVLIQLLQPHNHALRIADVNTETTCVAFCLTQHGKIANLGKILSNTLSLCLQLLHRITQQLFLSCVG